MRVYKRVLISTLLIFGLIFVFSYLPGKNLDSSLQNTVMDNLKISQSNVLYNENFDDGVADSWTTLGGTWTVENNQYKVTGTSQERVRSYYTAETFSYYIYEGDFKLVSGDEIQVIFNIHDIFYGVDQGHYCQITCFYDDPGDRKDTAILYSTQNGQIEHKRMSYNFNYNQWYHFSVVSSRETVEFFLNNSLVLSYSGVFYHSGYIGVKSMFGPIAYWDNIMVIGFNNSGKIQINGNSDWINLKNTGNCTGQGTYSDPYVIEDSIINAGGSGTCLLIENSNVFFKIDNCTMLNSGSPLYAGITLINVSNGQIINTTVNGHVYGITLDNCNNNLLIGNSVCYNDNGGIFIINGNNNTFLDNNVENNYAIGLRLEFSSSNMINENSINNNWGGVSLIWSHENNIWGNNVSYNSIGIYCYSTFNCNISGNIIDNNDYGLEYSDNNKNHTISGNIVNNNIRGISLSGFDNNDNNISENTINFNVLGIYSDENHNNLILGNEINGNSQYGICLSYSDYNVIKFNQITNNHIGIYLFYSNYNEILNNTFNGNSIDIKEYIEIEYPYPYENIIILLSVIVVIIIIAVVLAKRKHNRPKLYESVKPRENFQLTKESIIEKSLGPERETDLLIHSKVETITNLQKDKVIGGEVEVEEKGIVSQPILVKGEKEMEIERSTVSKSKSGEEELIQVKNHYCTNCGKLLESSWKVCPFCSANIRKDQLALESEKIQMEKKGEVSTLIPPETPIILEKRKIPKPTKNVCPFCGYENELDKTYCHQCGYKFKIL